MMQPGRYWPDFCAHIGRPELAADPRFDSGEKLIENFAPAAEIVAAAIASRTFAEWTERFESLEGQWAAVQNSVELGRDPQLRANGYIAAVTDVDGNERELVTAPVQFDESPATLTRGPEFAEHTDEILKELGRDEEAIINLKIAGAVT
jgi:crotonobetainyl-CoA:carnitine CoA-transferase CaiB-like acyl-CoA transferase